MGPQSTPRFERARGTASRAGRRRAVRASIALLLLTPQLTGCFQYQPAVSPVLAPGAQVRLGLTDQGRLALADDIGPGVRELGGGVLASNDTTLVLAVNYIDYLDIVAAVRWTGQRVAVPRQYAVNVRQRQLSKTRSWLFAGVLAVLAAAASTLAIVASGGGSDETNGGDNVDQ
jgi:hypothetical protein